MSIAESPSPQYRPPRWEVLPADVDVLPNGARRCTASAWDRDENGDKLETKHRCMAAVMRGSTVCQSHGGSAPQVKHKARLNLLALVDPAIATLGREMTTAAKSSDRLRAAENVLDRAGFPRQASFDVVESKQLLIARLTALRDRQYAEEDESGADVVDILEVEE